MSDVEDPRYDEAKEEIDAESENVENYKSVVYHVLSQVSIGMDLTKVVLPTFILEKRSMLEMFADFFAYTDIFMSISKQTSARARFVAVVRFFLSTIAAGRKSGWGKKPYNPILGEYFQCFYDDKKSTTDAKKEAKGPVPWARTNQVSIMVEKVSHHPLVTGMYAECGDAGIQYDGHIWTKSKFYGLSIGIELIGEGRIKLIDFDEEYVITFPSIMFRSIFTVPWSEFCGDCSVTCEKTGYQAHIKFQPKPFYWGKRDCISAELFETGLSTPFAKLDGRWSEQVNITYANKKKKSSTSEVLFNHVKLTKSKKKVRHFDSQNDWESRRHWINMTEALRRGDMDGAQDVKIKFEGEQRKLEKERRQNGTRYEPRHFINVDGDPDKWTYKNKLSDRVTKS